MLDSLALLGDTKGDWSAFLEAIAGVLPAEAACIFGPTPEGDRLVVYARSATDLPEADSLAVELARPSGMADTGAGHLARIVELASAAVPLAPGLAEPHAAYGIPTRCRHAVTPLPLPCGRGGWLAAVADPSAGDAAAFQDLLDRVAGWAPTVADRLAAEARAELTRCQTYADGLAESAPLTFLVSADGALVAHSPHAARVLELGTLAKRSAAGQLRLATPAASAHLESAIEAMATRDPADPTAQRIIRIDSRDAVDHWVAVVRPIASHALTGSGALAPAVPRPACWVALRGRRIAGVPAIDLLRQAFAFSQREAELVRHLMHGGSAAAHAEERGVTADASSYLIKQIYQKTGCRRHNELVMLMHAVLGPAHVPSAIEP